MDARITKSRLANLLSYDWLKIIAAIAAAVVALAVLFTTAKTRPAKEQVFTIYGYGELQQGSASEEIARRLENGVLSYDILKVEQETFGQGQYSGAALAARLSVRSGTVIFATKSALQEGFGGDQCPLTRDLDVYLSDCENYLIRFFGENWRTGEIDEAEAEACFLARNGNDRRYRTEAKKAAGVKDELSRLEKLRSDFIFVKDYLDSGKLPFVTVTDENDVPHPKAFALGGLASIRNYYYYVTEEGSPSGTDVCMLIFTRDSDEGKSAKEVKNDLRYETISYLRLLVESFGS